jgi:putative transcriptional regulator
MTERKNKSRLAAEDAGVKVKAGSGRRVVRQLVGAYAVERNRPRAKSPALEAVHSAAKDLHEAGALDVLTMRHFDRMCLSEVTLSAEEVRAIRHQNRLSQTVFARYLGTSESTVKQWESGAKQPSGMARTLLNAVRKHGIDVLS